MGQGQEYVEGDMSRKIGSVAGEGVGARALASVLACVRRLS